MALNDYESDDFERLWEEWLWTPMKVVVTLNAKLKKVALNA